MWKKQRILLSLPLSLMMTCCFEARAEDAITLSVGGLSYHLDGEEYSRSKHNLVGITYGHVSTGTFINSYNHRAGYIGYSTEKKELGDGFSVSAIVGAVSGYRSCYGNDGSKSKLCPLLVPVIEYKSDQGIFAHARPAVLILGTAVVFAIDIPYSL